MTEILVIDDSPEDREMLCDLLKQAKPDVRITACEGGRDGLPQAERQAFDVVLLDLRLDGEAGLDVLARLREMRPNLPIVLLTGHDSEQAAAESFVAGAAYYLPKDDLSVETLWTAVAAW